ncbi:MAG: glucuronate isomerase [Bacillota bacterium]|jgi:glucuronate isomerase|nr:glucuronate isomerase [Bacillota bacterium]HHU43016.1 glucuronate isomerase [Clostridiales bacterium]
MKEFLSDTFFLSSEVSKELYFDYALNLPIMDFHSHLDTEDIYRDKPFKSLYELWLKGDHYKWRLMRCSGYAEEYITGDAEDYEKFLCYVKSIQSAVHNPLYIWSHLELKKYFGIHKPIKEDTALEIWQESTKILEQTKLSPRKCLKLSKADIVFTTDDAMSDLTYHKLLWQENYNVKVYPTFRGDRAININKEFLDELEKKYQKKVKSLDEYMELVFRRIDYFSENKSKASDFAIEDLPTIISKEDADKIFDKFLRQEIQPSERKKLSSYILLKSIGHIHKRKMALQLHIGATRDNNTLLFERLSKDCGCDGISDKGFIDGLGDLLDKLKSQDRLPNTIIYNLNPAFNQALAALCGCFSDSKSNVQLGAAWWFQDHKDGIEAHLKTFSSNLNLSRFVGMLTDSRSFISFSRHDYFRRILCDFIGEKVTKGEFYYDKKILEKMVKDICYFNAIRFFDIKN